MISLEAVRTLQEHRLRKVWNELLPDAHSYMSRWTFSVSIHRHILK
jgi:hypothetical protein